MEKRDPVVEQRKNIVDPKDSVVEDSLVERRDLDFRGFSNREKGSNGSISREQGTRVFSTGSAVREGIQRVQEYREGIQRVQKYREGIQGSRVFSTIERRDLESSEVQRRDLEGSEVQRRVLDGSVGYREGIQRIQQYKEGIKMKQRRELILLKYTGI